MATSIQNASDSEFLDIMDQVKAELAANPANFPSVTVAMKTALDNARDGFGDGLTAHQAAQADAKAKRLSKDALRDVGEAIVRDIRNVSKAGGVTEAHLAALGIPASSEKAPSSATVPSVKVDTSARMRHTLEWRDSATPENKRKPKGAMGAEIWVKIDGTPPGNEKDCTFLTLDAFTPYLAEYDAADAGKTAHYMLRWHMRDGTNGAWGETVSATITG